MRSTIFVFYFRTAILRLFNLKLATSRLHKHQEVHPQHKITASEEVVEESEKIQPISPEEINEALHELVYNDDQADDSPGWCTFM